MIELNTIKGKFYIRPYKRGDEHKIIKLFYEVFGQKKSMDLWKWEFLKNPYGCHIMLCEHECGQIISQCAGLVVPIFFDGKIHLGAQLVDCMNKKKYRAFAVKKKGLFALTVQTFFDEFTGKDKDIYLFGFPGDRHYRLGKIWLGYKKIRPIDEIKINNIQKDFRSYFFSIDSLNKQDLENKENIIYKLALNDAALVKFSVFRESKYLIWRYIESPREYKIYCLKNIFGRIKCVFVISEDGNVINLIDIIGLNFLKQAIIYLSSMYRGKTVRLWLPKNCPFCMEFKNFSSPSSIPVIPVGRSFWEGLNWDWANKNFFYTMGDCDLF